MEAHDDEFGPIDILVIAYPPGAPMTGEAMPIFLDLVDRGIIRVLDALFVLKAEDGTRLGLRRQRPGRQGRRGVRGVRGSVLRPARRRRCRDRRGGARPRVRRGHDRVREPLGGTVRQRGAPQRRRDGRERAHPRAGHSRRPRRRRSGGLTRKDDPMPGLLRGIARTAVIAGTATSVSNRVSRRQANRWAEQDAPAYQEQAPPPAAAGGRGARSRSSSSSSSASCTSRACSPTRSSPRRRPRSWARTQGWSWCAPARRRAPRPWRPASGRPGRCRRPGRPPAPGSASP